MRAGSRAGLLAAGACLMLAAAGCGSSSSSSQSVATAPDQISGQLKVYAY
jgi:hypothetical protein